MPILMFLNKISACGKGLVKLRVIKIFLQTGASNAIFPMSFEEKALSLRKFCFSVQESIRRPEESNNKLNFNRMSYNLLKGKRGIIFGALNDMSIAWKVAEKAVAEGAIITLSNTPIAVRMGEVTELGVKLNAEIIAADATSVEDLGQVFAKSMEVLGGKIDFVLHSIGMSPNVRKKRPYDDLDYDLLNKTLDISAISFHKMIQVAKKMDAIAEGGSIVALSYVAAQRTLYGYNDMADAKSMLESIARSFGYIYGREKGVRVNTISQSPTMTTAGSGVKGMEKLLDFSERMSPLGNASADECADYCITMFSDLTRKVTMQNLFHDGGFSSMGISLRAMNQYEKSFDEYRDENGNIIYG
jgi:enoyl-[acyl-carrier protein] reductase I